MPPSDNSVAVNNNNNNNNNTFLPENIVKGNILWRQKPNQNVSGMYKHFNVKKILFA